MFWKTIQHILAAVRQSWQRWHSPARHSAGEVCGSGGEHDGKALKKERNGTNGVHPLEWEAGWRGWGFTNLVLNICFAYSGLASLNEGRQHLKSSWLKSDWQVGSLSEPSARTIFILFLIYAGTNSSSLTGKIWQPCMKELSNPAKCVEEVDLRWLFKWKDLFSRFGRQTSTQNKNCGLDLFSVDVFRTENRAGS